MEGGREVIGPQETDRLFARLNNPGEAGLADLNRLLVDEYGGRGGQGVALRVGRAFFRRGVRYWISAGMNSAEFRLLPSQRRIRAALAALTSFFTTQFEAHVALEEDEATWSWRVESCPASQEHDSGGRACYLLAGVLQEIVTWAGGERIYRVREVECSAVGAAACLFQIDKKPLD
jgi:predicted hydrocarbon binding protein